MDLATIELNVEELDTSQGFDLIYDLLAAYGMPKATIARLRKGSTNLAKGENERLLRNKVYYRFVEEWESNHDIHAVIDDAASDEAIAKAKPRFLIVRDHGQLVAMDRSTGETLDVPLEKLHLHASFFLPWAGIEKAQVETAHYADIKAAEKMARLYDEIRKINEISTDAERHALNVFFSRLLFCFFAEDTGIFEPGQVTGAIGSLTREDGEDLHTFLARLFDVLNTPIRERSDLPSYLEAFGYVNGSLFSEQTVVPLLSAKARKVILECAELDWSEINPDIFGSMMQAVVHPEDRAGLGMHYTSAENIMKVLRPLFLDELNEELEAAEDDPRKLRKLHDRISKIKVFDPACGSGNFLVIAYKELRGIEHRVLERLRELEADPKGTGLFEVSRISLDNFYGIEIDDFASEIARLSLWLAKHQVDKRFEELFGSQLQMIPLREGGRVTTGNATRLDWDQICPGEPAEEVALCGNPPYCGFRNQTPAQKDDIAEFDAIRGFPKKLDYVAMWFILAADFVASRNSRFAFVSTSSITQGDQVGLLFPRLFNAGMVIEFAHRPFLWANSARGGAGVTCVVIGMGVGTGRPKRLFTRDSVHFVDQINAYLTAGPETVVLSAAASISGLPRMAYGNMPLENGYLILSEFEYKELVQARPSAARFTRRYMGADEFLNGAVKYCLWIPDDDVRDAVAIPEIAERVSAVQQWRSSSKSGRQSAQTPWRFNQCPHEDIPALIVPIVSSERRKYVPIGFVGPDTIISNAAEAIYGGAPWLLGLLQSAVHMSWLRTVGGRLKSDYRYSASLVYNTFPVPDLTDEEKQRLSTAALGVLAAREQYPDQTLAQLYDPDKMPLPLRAAHEALDDVVDRIYRPDGFASDDERLELLFAMYEELTSKEKLGA